ncbi:hypothetical protein F5883DRAFT_655908 [Diaporthe sp. PMI_573]|nr:hypothetical protein F5883DRAFT_655908 [Diaporthaceae sp. PMI_573]
MPPRQQQINVQVQSHPEKLQELRINALNLSNLAQLHKAEDYHKWRTDNLATLDLMGAGDVLETYKTREDVPDHLLRKQRQLVRMMLFYPWCRGGAALAGATPQPRPVLISAGPLTGATSSLPALSSAPAPAYRGSRQQRCERYLGITSSRHHQPQSHALDWPTHRPRYNRTKEEEDLEKGVASSSRSLGAGMRLSNRHRGTEAELRRRRRGRSGLGAI